MFEIKNHIANNKKIFEKNIEVLNNLSSFVEKQRLASKLIRYALTASTGYYASYDIECVFLALAQSQSLNDLPTDFTHNSVLHVMTQSYDVGGHTRVVERWIEYSSSEQIHSLIFTSAENHCIPDRLITVVNEKKGEIINLPDHLSDLEKGLTLRRIASNYQMIILHVHPHDVIPLIAFGHTEFKRPIAFFNHADHKFWIGVSISDIIVNFRIWGEEVCQTKRGVLNNFLLGLPVSSVAMNENVDQAIIRNELNLPIDMKIVTSVGSWHKFKPITLDKNFIHIIDTLLTTFPKLLFIIVGSFFKDLKGWEDISQKHQNRIIAVGPKSPKDMFKYLHASDLVIDTYPMSGGTALIDAVSCTKPVLSLDCPTGQLDYVMNSAAYCKTIDELINKANEILLDPVVADKNIKSVQNEISTSNSMEIWCKRLNHLYDRLANTFHQTYVFKSSDVNDLNDNDVYLYSEYKRIRSKFKIPFLIDFYTLHNNGIKYRKILLLSKFKITISKIKILE